MNIADIELFEHKLLELRKQNLAGSSLIVLEAQLAVSILKHYLKDVERAKEVLYDK